MMTMQVTDKNASAFKVSQYKGKPLSTLGHNIIGNSTLIPFDRTQVNRPGGQETLAKSVVDSRRTRPNFTRGVGLTPRLFEALLHADPAPIEALPSAYVNTISRHVESVEPSKQVFSQYWCPVVVEDDIGERHVLHVDPVVVRKFRRTIAEELQHVQEKRKRMLGRIHTIREHFPQTHARDVILRLQREIAEAKSREEETLLQPFSEETSTLHVFLEATPHMAQLELVCQYLIRELPNALATSGVQRVSFTALKTGIVGDSSTRNVESLPSLSPLDWKDPDSWNAACEWVASLKPQIAISNKKKTKKGQPQSSGFEFARALRWATTHDALENGKNVVVLLACSEPVDLDACIGLARRSNAELQLIGVFGLSPEDPEAGLQRLVDAATLGSSLRFFFGSTYWREFAALRERQLQQAEQSEWGAEASSAFVGNPGENEIVSDKVFEMRLIERIMRECYSEEQQCEEELTCATRVFERTLIDNEDITAVLRDRNKAPLSSLSRSAPATARYRIEGYAC